MENGYNGGKKGKGKSKANSNGTARKLGVTGFVVALDVFFLKTHTPPETNTAPAGRPSQRETSIPTIHFQVRTVKGRVPGSDFFITVELTRKKPSVQGKGKGGKDSGKGKGRPGSWREERVGPARPGD